MKRILDITNLDSMIDLLESPPKLYNTDKGNAYIQPFMNVFHKTLGCSVCCRCSNVNECSTAMFVALLNASGDSDATLIVHECRNLYLFKEHEDEVEVRIG